MEVSCHLPVLSSDSKVAIVGSGAVGGYYGARLVEAGYNVHFLLRGDYDHVRVSGMRIDSVAGDIHLPEVQCAESTADIGPVDLVIIAWKTTANAHYEQVIRPLLHEKTQILTLQNGLGNVETLGGLFGASRIYGGLCFVCINRLGPGHLHHSASGMVRVGKFEASADGISDSLTQLVGFMKKGGVDCHAVANLQAAQWMKLIWNIPFNGLAIAEGGVDTSVLLATAGMESRIRKIMAEIQQVAKVMGHEIGDDFIEKQIALTRPMKAYRPSSMIDFVQGREVEVDALWREPVRKAHDLGVPVPEIERLLCEIEQRLEQRGN